MFNLHSILRLQYFAFILNAFFLLVSVHFFLLQIRGEEEDKEKEKKKKEEETEGEEEDKKKKKENKKKEKEEGRRIKNQ